MEPARPTKKNRPTIPGTVNENTPTNHLNLNWCEKDLPEDQRTKHVNRLHPYLGKYIPQLAEIFLRKYFELGQRVLDPFCGSGTTLVQANELGINSIGCDISAFNILLCRAKTAFYNQKEVRGEILDILEKTRIALKQEKTSQSLLRNNLYLKSWFAPRALNELLIFRDFIVHYRNQDILKIILSRSARSARLTTHFDLDFPRQPQSKSYHCYKHSRECRPTQEAFKFIKRYALDTVERLSQFGLVRTASKIDLVHGDSREMHFPKVDGVLTSPPYVGLIDYHEQHIYAYHLLGLEDKSSEEIGAASGGTSRKAQHQYQIDMANVFRRASQSMKRGSPIIVVAADRSNLYDEIREMAKLKAEEKITREVNRRTGRRAGSFFESIFVWRKP